MKKFVSILLVVLLVGLVTYIGVGHVQKRIEVEKLATANSVMAQLAANTTPKPTLAPTPMETLVPVNEPKTLQEAIDETIVEDDDGIYHVVFENTDGVEVLDYEISDDETNTFFFVMKGSKLVGKYYHKEDEATTVHKGKQATIRQVARCFCKNGEIQSKYLLLGFLDGEVTEFEIINFDVKVGRIKEHDGSYTYGLILCGGHSNETSGGGDDDTPVPTPAPTGEPTATIPPATEPPVVPTHEPTQVPPTHGPTVAPTHEATTVPVSAPDPTLPPRHEATSAPQKTAMPTHEETLPSKGEEIVLSNTHEDAIVVTTTHEETSETEEELPPK